MSAKLNIHLSLEQGLKMKGRVAERLCLDATFGLSWNAFGGLNGIF